MASERVTIGVPVYRGEAYLEGALRSIQAQTHRDFDVLISFDEPSAACEAICARFADDDRFTVSHRPERLGWVGNINWLMTQVRNPFWYFHQQDDVVAPEYVETLLRYAQAHPEAALVYCDIATIGRPEGQYGFQGASLREMSAFARMITLLHEHFPAFPFRGLTRASALCPIPRHPVRDFAVDICWVAAIARAGEVHRIERTLYWKHYHDTNTHAAWWTLPKERQLEAWAWHCVGMLEEAMQIQAMVQERRLLWLAAIERLTSERTAPYLLRLAELCEEDRETLFQHFLAGALASTRMNLPDLLEAEWEDICAWARGFYWSPGERMLEIEGFGPESVEAGERFCVQPDGSSALWVRLKRSAEPGARLQLGDLILPTVNMGRMLTATVPEALTAAAAELPLGVVDRNGKARSAPVILRVKAATAE